MSVPHPSGGMDPMPQSRPTPPLGDDIPDPTRPGRRPDAPDTRPDPAWPRPDGTLTLVAVGREDRRRHVVEMESGEFGDPTGLRARCGAPVERVVPGLSADQADCPVCTTPR